MSKQFSISEIELLLVHSSLVATANCLEEAINTETDPDEKSEMIAHLEIFSTLIPKIADLRATTYNKESFTVESIKGVIK